MHGAISPLPNTSSRRDAELKSTGTILLNIRVIESKICDGWSCSMHEGDEKYRTLVERPEEKSPSGIPRGTEKDIKVDIKEIWYNVVEWVQLC
jgi:hypothetical protein